jgi:UDP-N-acetylmuramoyl-tripeptide--D-alanyl-D-alanine ligase
VIARYLEIPITTDLSQFVMPPGRSNYFEGKKGIKIIDSTYNALLLSMQSILDMYSQIDEPHKCLVIGDMIEQGKSEASEHQKLANLLQTMKVETIILVGKRTAKYVLPILEESSLTSTIKSFTTTQDALAYIETNGTGRETILLKGSQYLEWIVEKLLAHPADISHLARQEPAAKKRRLERGLS